MCTLQKVYSAKDRLLMPVWGEIDITVMLHNYIYYPNT